MEKKSQSAPLKEEKRTPRPIDKATEKLNYPPKERK